MDPDFHFIHNNENSGVMKISVSTELSILGRARNKKKSGIG